MKRINGGRSQRQYMIWAFKLSGCNECGIRPPDIALEDLACHHRDPTTKTVTGSRSMTKRNDGLLGHNSHDELLAELAKCDVLCRNCHGRRHNGTHTLAEQQPLFVGTGNAWSLTGGRV